MPRKKEPERIDRNKERIAKVAKELFLKHGIENTRIDEVAKVAGMSKSTLYVYFKSKEEIQDYISLEAMRYLLEQFQQKVPHGTDDKIVTLHEQYMAICHVMVEFKCSYPLNFQLIIEEIKVDADSLAHSPILRELYQVGEQINQYVIGILMGRPELAEEKDMPDLIAKIFAQWGSIYGLIVLADNKEQYITRSMHMTKEEFLERGFEQLYQTMKWAD